MDPKAYPSLSPEEAEKASARHDRQYAEEQAAWARFAKQLKVPKDRDRQIYSIEQWPAWRAANPAPKDEDA